MGQEQSLRSDQKTLHLHSQRFVGIQRDLTQKCCESAQFVLVEPAQEFLVSLQSDGKHPIHQIGSSVGQFEKNDPGITLEPLAFDQTLLDESLGDLRRRRPTEKCHRCDLTGTKRPSRPSQRAHDVEFGARDPDGSKRRVEQVTCPRRDAAHASEHLDRGGVDVGESGRPLSSDLVDEIPT